jgi:hypothetical protein
MLGLHYGAHTMHISLTWAEIALFDILEGIATGADRILIVTSRN